MAVTLLYPFIGEQKHRDDEMIKIYDIDNACRIKVYHFVLLS